MHEQAETKRSGFRRRTFLTNASAFSAATLLGISHFVAAEPPPETPKIRLVHAPAICLAPIWVARELLHAEGFTDVEYVPLEKGTGPGMLADGRADISMWDALSTFQPLDTGKPVVVVAGIHAGCWELFGHGDIQTIRDLKGKTVAIQGVGAGDHILLSSMLAYVGMVPHRDVVWIEGANMAAAMRLFIDGQADAFMGFAPQPQELRAQKVGHVIVDTAQDRPWSQYFCCMVTVRRDFARQHPAATKRALRALLKAADLCSAEPEWVARDLVAKGYEPRYEVGLEVLKALPYNRWRQSDPEDTLRFHALRLHEVGMIKSSPQKLIAQGTDWRFLNELKKELKE
jgi:NitT/TauT family transport system substrate-binding protein